MGNQVILSVMSQVTVADMLLCMGALVAGLSISPIKKIITAKKEKK